jgi:hypothetical protein
MVLIMTSTTMIHATDHDRSHAKQNGLHGVKPYKAIVLVGLQHQKDDPGNHAEEIRQRRFA